ncbi:MAG: DUF4097 family beta strand repeat protein [Chloroflexi bacterium]|nr:DUF4097 family beta strand repeat protein [Chloroflexota bacterium]
MAEYPCSDPITIKTSIAAGSIKITTEDRDTVAVDVTSPDDGAAAEATEVSFNGNTLEITYPDSSRGWFRRHNKVDVVVVAPLDSTARIGVASASVECRGKFDQMKVKTASGNVDIDDVTGDLEVQSASGDTRVASVGGQLSFRSASGRLEVSDVGGSIGVKTASGKIEIGAAGGDVKAQSASGSLQVGAAHRGIIIMKTASGKASVGVAPGTGVWLDLDSTSGRINTGLDTVANPPDNRDLTIRIRTVSGSIDILRAVEPATVQDSPHSLIGAS